MLGKVYDLAIIGGGINGAAIARDAAGRGLTVFLCEEGDLGGGASSATGKLVHGGLRYLEGWQLGAMREAVVERRILLHAAPHLLRPTRFRIPHHERQWSPVALSLGLFAFDHLARSGLPRARRVDLEAEEAPGDLQPHFALAFEYSDCVADDARLVILNALDARARGASIHPRLRCTVAEREGGVWRLALETALTGERFVVHAGFLVNASGAAVADVNNHVVHARHRIGIRLTKSTAIVVRRDHWGDRSARVGYALPNADGRIVYAVPWHAGTMLIGAATRDVEGATPAAGVERSDVAYLRDVIRQYFHTPVSARDVVWVFSGLTALPEEAGATIRERAVALDAPPRMAPLLTVFGGTLTSHRRLAEGVVDRLAKFRPLKAAWTAHAALPGGGFPVDGIGDLVRAMRAAYPFVPEEHAMRLVLAYGTRASSVLTGARSAGDLGIRFGADLTEAEVDYLLNEEWAMTAEDVLWRRSKLGLAFSEAEADALGEWMAERQVAAHPVI
ncbi:MAG: glycerol-3-phosphate dehydrogenase [Bauldia sp.]|nr:glycerol-3-phosphate dehydrogenase [Bauldia sp.]